MADSPTAQADSSRKWAHALQWPVLALATAAALYLAYAHVVLTHGSGTFDSLCNIGGKLNCDAVNTSAWASLLGAPISAWALPVYAVMAWLAARARGTGEAAARAQGGLVVLALFNVLVSVFLAYVSIMDIGFLCLFENRFLFQCVFDFGCSLKTIGLCFNVDRGF